MSIEIVILIGVALIGAGWAVWLRLNPPRPSWAEAQDNLKEGTRYWDSVVRTTNSAWGNKWR